MPLPPFFLKVVPHTLRFLSPAGTSRGVYTLRKVWYIVLTSAQRGIRFTGLGECAPLHDLSGDYDSFYEVRLREICAQIERTQHFDSESLRAFPSILFGLECAFRSARGSLEGNFLKLYESPFTRGAKGIPINGLVWMGNFEEMSARMEEKLAQGFRCVKLKIGAIDFESELKLIARLRERFSPQEVELRVDANGAFSPKEAPERLEKLARFGIHSIEQPIAQGQWAAMAELCRISPIPIALDEELIGVNDPVRKAELLERVHPRYIILKPTLHGGLSGAEEWMRLARERGIAFWTTSALESNVGLNAIAQWCAATDPATPLPQGLGTGQLFAQNFPAPLFIEGDCLFFGAPKERAFKKEVEAFGKKWADASPTLSVHTSGSTGTPKAMEVKKESMRASAQATIKALRLSPGQTALLCLPIQYIAGQMMYVRSRVAHLPLQVVSPCAHPYAGLHDAPHLAALTPMQVYESLHVPHEKALLRRTKCLIIGGGSIPEEVEAQLKGFPHQIWSTYGMTESLSHIALRRLNGRSASPSYFPLPGVQVSLSPSGTLQVFAPKVNPRVLTTNDLAEILPDGSFQILGRVDNIICSGGLKFSIEQMEAKLSKLPCPFQITSTPDSRLGSAVTLLFEGRPAQIKELETLCRAALPSHQVPRRYIPIPKLPLTPTGKPARAQARELAEAILKRSF